MRMEVRVACGGFWQPQARARRRGGTLDVTHRLAPQQPPGTANTSPRLMVWLLAGSNVTGGNALTWGETFPASPKYHTTTHTNPRQKAMKRMNEGTEDTIDEINRFPGILKIPLKIHK